MESNEQLNIGQSAGEAEGEMLKAENFPPPEGLLASCHFNRFIFDTAAGDVWLNDHGWKEGQP